MENEEVFAINIFINLIVGIIVQRCRLLSKKGICASYVLGVVVFAMSPIGYAFLLCFFGITAGVEHLIIRTEKNNFRTEGQVICNSLPALWVLCLFYFLKQEKYFFIYTCLLASSLADSTASAIGNQYAKKIYSVFTLREMERGISGGISAVGTIAGMLAATIMGMIYVICCPLHLFRESIINVAKIAMWGTVGMMIDSILGISFQKKYRCLVCQKKLKLNSIVEKRRFRYINFSSLIIIP
ncbi:MAG: DUF92 domain-containing protein [Eubacteriales bacterium]|nr:DUF92 domain-containing protein [Eubacteriales bacterium]